MWGTVLIVAGYNQFEASIRNTSGNIYKAISFLPLKMKAKAGGKNLEMLVYMLAIWQMAYKVLGVVELPKWGLST